MESYFEDHDIHLITYYKPMKRVVIIYITISVIFIFKAHGKYSILQALHLNYDVIIRNHEHYLWNLSF